MSKPNIHTEVFAGAADTAYQLEVSPQYTTNEISVLSGSGRITVEAKHVRNNTFEEVSPGTLILDVSRTMLIKGYQIKEFQFTQTESAAFTVYVTQSNPVRDSAP